MVSRTPIGSTSVGPFGYKEFYSFAETGAFAMKVFITKNYMPIFLKHQFGIRRKQAQEILRNDSVENLLSDMKHKFPEYRGITLGSVFDALVVCEKWF